MTVLDAELIRLMSFFEKKTGAKLKDCFFDQNQKLTFIVTPGNIGKAIGKGAKTLRKLEELLSRRIRIAQYSPDRALFIQSLVSPLKLVDIEEFDDIIVLKGADEKTNGLLIGKQARNLRNLEWMVRRYFPCKEIKVIS